MNIFTIFFLQNILQNAPNCTIFKNFLGGVCPRTPIANAWLRHALHMALRAMQIPQLLQKYFEPPPPEMKS